MNITDLRVLEELSDLELEAIIGGSFYPNVDDSNLLLESIVITRNGIERVR
jgi:bacteriocin-like protein